MTMAQIGNMQVLDLREVIPVHPDPENRYARREPQEIEYLVIHHSAGRNTASPEEIALQHIRQGWPTLGYHLYVWLDLLRAIFQVAYCVDLSRISYHARQANPRGVGICMAGDFTTNPPPLAQLEACRTLVAEVQYQLGWFVPVLPHRAFVQTACPGATWQQWFDQVVVLPPE